MLVSAALEQMGEPSRDAETVTGLLREMADNPMPTTAPCPWACCTSASLFTNFPIILNKSQGAIFFVLVDSIGEATEEERSRLANQLDQTHSLVCDGCPFTCALQLYLVRLADSYCGSDVETVYAAGLTNTNFALKTNQVASVGLDS